jgi:hypothetical protein
MHMGGTHAANPKPMNIDELPRVIAVRSGWIVAVVLAVVAVGCKSASFRTPLPDGESRPEGVGRIVKVEPNAPIGIRLHLESDIVLTIGPPGTRTAVQTANGPDSLAVYGHDGRGLWVLWLGLEAGLGPDCFALPRLGYDRPGFIGWPDGGFALPKAAGFRVEGGVSLDRDPQSGTFGWYSNGGLVPHATFCISSQGEVTAVSI